MPSRLRCAARWASKTPRLGNAGGRVTLAADVLFRFDKQRRAQAMAAALRRELGGDAPGLAVRGHGEADPVAANTKKDGSDNPKDRARNRRVTITFPR